MFFSFLAHSALNGGVPMQIESTQFKPKEAIPSRYTCEGEDLSPPLNFKNVPSKAKTLALIVDDPDAPMGTFDHWIVWNIPADKKGLAEGESLGVEGANHFGELHYRGPCPPRGLPHRYFFKLYALDAELDLQEGSTKETLEKAMQGHILEKSELIGTYKR